MDTVLWLCPSLFIETLKWLSSLPILMQESFWRWQCSDRYILSLSPHLHTPFPPFSPSLISLTVSVDVKHHVHSAVEADLVAFLSRCARAGGTGCASPTTALSVATSWAARWSTTTSPASPPPTSTTTATSCTSATTRRSCRTCWRSCRTPASSRRRRAPWTTTVWNPPWSWCVTTPSRTAATPSPASSCLSPSAGETGWNGSLRAGG